MKKTITPGNYRTVTPSYGRDYKTKKAATDAFLGGKDFTLQPEGCQCDVKDFVPGVTVCVRYSKNTKVVPVKVPN